MEYNVWVTNWTHFVKFKFPRLSYLCTNVVLQLVYCNQMFNDIAHKTIWYHQIGRSSRPGKTARRVINKSSDSLLDVVLKSQYEFKFAWKIRLSSFCHISDPAINGFDCIDCSFLLSNCCNLAAFRWSSNLISPKWSYFISPFSHAYNIKVKYHYWRNEKIYWRFSVIKKNQLFYCAVSTRLVHPCWYFRKSICTYYCIRNRYKY